MAQAQQSDQLTRIQNQDENYWKDFWNSKRPKPEVSPPTPEEYKEQLMERLINEINFILEELKQQKNSRKLFSIRLFTFVKEEQLEDVVKFMYEMDKKNGTSTASRPT